MEVRYIKQIDQDNIKKKQFDLIIASSGYEIRANYIANVLNNNCNEKIVFSFSDHRKEKSRLENDLFFKKHNFKSFEITGNSYSKILEVINGFIEQSKSQTLSILIDYSSMTRIWYGAIIKYFKQLDRNKQTIIVYFCYTIAKFHQPPERDSKTSNFEPINGYCSLSIPLYPSALITGLGYERNKAFGLKEFFDAELLYLFYTNGNDYTEHVLQINQELIKRTPKQNVLSYNVNDLLLTKTILYELCSSLKENYRVIIAPLGPKPFTLVSFLVANELQSIDVWRISSNEIFEYNYCEPNGNIVTLEICYEQSLVGTRSSISSHRFV
jgi:hypothetical protein